MLSLLNNILDPDALLKGCGGVVAAQAITYTWDQLETLQNPPNSNSTTQQFDEASPDSCGANPNYTITWSMQLFPEPAAANHTSATSDARSNGPFAGVALYTVAMLGVLAAVL